MPRTLVTGATGLVGNNVVRLLLEQGDAVRVLARPSSATRPLEGLDVEIARGDVEQPDTVRAACQGVERVIHCAGYVRIGYREMARHLAINTEGTRHVAEAARDAGARLVHVSSCDTLGACSLEEPADEQTPPGPSVPVPYVITKRAADRLVLELAEEGLDAVIVHPAFMLGPWDWTPSSGRMLLASARWVPVCPRGHMSICDVRDVATAIVAAAEGGAPHRRYLLAGRTMTYFEAMRAFAAATGGRPPRREVSLRLVAAAADLWGYLRGREGDVNSGVVALCRLPKHFSSQRAIDELGYRVRPLNETVRDAWSWFQEYGYA